MRISKSNYLIGRQCARRLWLAKHGSNAEPKLESDDIWELRELEGAAVERCVESCYANSTRIAAHPNEDETDESTGEPETLADLTREAIRQRRTIFQAQLQTDDLLAVIDILEPRGDAWFVWEVKASTSVTPIHDHDLAFQVETARRSGLEIAGAGVWLLNKDYVRGEALDSGRLLQQIIRSEPVTALADDTRTEIDRQLKLLRNEHTPVAEPGSHCKANRDAKNGDRPSSCGQIQSEAHCGRELPEDWTGTLPNLSPKKTKALAASGIRSISKIDLDNEEIEWTPRQHRMISAVQTGTTFTDAEALGLELDKLQWPIAYVDFEFDPGVAIPRFRGTKPYTRIPFQWSMHIQQSEGSKLEQPEPFLWLDSTDPREPFLQSFLAALPTTGSIVAHSKAAEWTVLKQLANTFADYASQVAPLEERLFDTIDLLQSGYYHAAQRGSYSIKKAAPALLGHGYEDLDIQDGMAAVVGWRKAIDPATDPKTRDDLAASLREYCGRDTLLMYDIVEAVRDLVASRNHRGPNASEIGASD